MNNLKTSYVIVQQWYFIKLHGILTHLKTSYVIVQHVKLTQIKGVKEI